MFRDGITAGYENTLLSDYLPAHFGVLRVGAGQASSSNINAAFQAHSYEAPMSEHFLMMKLETHAVALQKKENEAYLSIFSKDHQPSSVLDVITSAEEIAGAPSNLSLAAPSAQLDSRTIDAAVLLIGATFAHQSMEYQDKAVQLCANAVAQFAKAGNSKTMNLFSSTSEEEKRRKDRMNYTTLRTVLATLCTIIQAHPSYDDVQEDDVPWRQTAVNLLYDMLAHSSYALRCASASALALLSNKLRGNKVVEGVSGKIRAMMMSALVKKVPDPNAPDYSGYLIALSTLWGSAAGLDDIQSLILTVCAFNVPTLVI